MSLRDNLLQHDETSIYSKNEAIYQLKIYTSEFSASTKTCLKYQGPLNTATLSERQLSLQKSHVPCNIHPR